MRFSVLALDFNAAILSLGAMKTPDANAASALLDWYDRHARPMPWRVPPADRRAGVLPDPYHVWLSEVMLQQTQVRTVHAYFLDFVERWRTVDAMAQAPADDVMKAWAGLGYYSRARNLKKCAEEVWFAHGGRFPQSASGLQALPGIGAYTGAAIAAIAFDEPIAVVDGNVERVMARLMLIEEPMPKGKERVRAAVQAMLPHGRPGDFAQAMMDLGATLCSPRSPACSLCPLLPCCAAAQLGVAGDYPRKLKKAQKPQRKGAAYVLRNGKGEVLLQKRPEKGLLGGMAGVPTTDWTVRADGGTGVGHAPVTGDWRMSGTVRHVFTHFELELEVWSMRTDAADQADGWWVGVEALAGEALPSVMKKVIAASIPEAFKNSGVKGQAMNNGIRHIVFDIGKVLIHYDPELGFLELLPDAGERAHFLANVCTPEWNIEQDRGRTWQEAEALLLAEHPQHEHLIRGFRRNWHAMVSHAYDDSVEILESLLAQGHDITFLTNFAADTFAEAQQRFVFLQKGRGVTVSGEVKLIKPQREIYDLHARTFALEPAATLFIDDSAKNVAAAIDAGWQALHFTSAQKLRADLEGLGIKA